MKLIRYSFLLTLLLTFAVASCSEKKKNPRELSEQDQKIADVLNKATFENLEGEEVSLDNYKGKVVLIDFWETWCGPCLQVFPAMDSLQNEYPEDFVILAVNLLGSDDTTDVKSFKEKNPYDFNYLLDVNNIGDEVISVGIPFKVYFDAEGYFIEAELGSRGVEGDYQKTKAIIEENKKS